MEGRRQVLWEDLRGYRNFSKRGNLWSDLPGEEGGTSISLNIAEGSGRSSRREFARFLNVATGSVFEAVAAVAIARERGFLTKDYYTEIYSSAEGLAKKIARLRKTLLARGSD